MKQTDDNDAPVSLSRKVIQNMIRGTPELQPQDGELSYRTRIEAFFCARWGCADSTFRKWNSRNFPPTRVPSIHENPAFFVDLKEWGEARFDKRGKLIGASLGQGPDEITFLRITREAKTQFKAAS